MIKTVPSDIGSMLTPRGLAYWIMDDGYWEGKTVKLCTDGFSLDEVELLIKTLNLNFGLIATVNKRISDNKNICWR